MKAKRGTVANPKVLQNIPMLPENPVNSGSKGNIKRNSTDRTFAYYSTSQEGTVSNINRKTSRWL
jgi:hypothetical protein